MEQWVVFLPYSYSHYSYYKLTIGTNKCVKLQWTKVSSKTCSMPMLLGKTSDPLKAVPKHFFDALLTFSNGEKASHLNYKDFLSRQQR